MKHAALYNYERRQRLIAAGTCVGCAERPATRGQRCDHCADKRNGRNPRWSRKWTRDLTA